MVGEDKNKKNKNKQTNKQSNDCVRQMTKLIYEKKVCRPAAVSQCGLVVRYYASIMGTSKQKDLSSIHFGCPFSSKIVVYGRCLVTFCPHN